MPPDDPLTLHLSLFSRSLAARLRRRRSSVSQLLSAGPATDNVSELLDPVIPHTTLTLRDICLDPCFVPNHI